MPSGLAQLFREGESMNGVKSTVIAALRALTVACVLVAGGQAWAKDVVVFAAASLKNALDEAAAAWTQETGKKVVVSYAGSNALAKQIEAGAPADLFISADLDWMDVLASKGLIRPETRVDLLGNALVVVAPRGEAEPLDLGKAGDLPTRLGTGRLAMGHVEAVPAGKYGKAALEKLGLWSGVKDKIAQSENVRAALLLVARGEAPLGIVYRSDAASDPNVVIVATFPKDGHPPIVYPAALTKESHHPDAAAFLTFLRSAKAAPFFIKQGLTVLAPSRSGS